MLAWLGVGEENMQPNPGIFLKKREISIEEQELKALKKELRDVKMERDILKKAVSIFSKSDHWDINSF